LDGTSLPLLLVKLLNQFKVQTINSPLLLDSLDYYKDENPTF